MWSLNTVTNFAPVTAVLTSPPPPDDTSVAANDVLNTVGALFPSATISLSLPSKLNFSNVYLPALVLPLSLSVQEPLPADAVCIFSPLAATIVLLNIHASNISSVDKLVCGTTFVLYFTNPFILLYPPPMSGSKFTSSSAYPGCMANVDLFRTNPPCNGNDAGDVLDKSAIYYTLVIKSETVLLVWGMYVALTYSYLLTNKLCIFFMPC